MTDSLAIDRVASELSDGMALVKCRQCGCMKDTLLGMQASFATPRMAAQTALASQIEGWLGTMQPIKYACLGCDYCIAASATNLFNQAFPDARDMLTLS